VENQYGPPCLAEFVFGPRLGKGWGLLIYTKSLQPN